MKLYSIYDRVSGLYSVPLCMQNDGVAKRNFPYICENDPQFKMFPGDLELYYIGDYNTSSGAIVPVDKPVFIMRYEREDLNE